MHPTRKLPLFVVTGASGVGKSTVCARLFARETRYIVLESDILWHPIWDRPGDGYRDYRELWLRLCANVSQIGLPVVLCGCAVPEQFEGCANRALVSEIHYLALVCGGVALETRMREGRAIEDETWIRSSLSFNQWLQTHGARTNPPMTVLDDTGLSVEETARRVDQWILGHVSHTVPEDPRTEA